MQNNKGSIEILLLLCCLVGVVSFFCFGLGIASLLGYPPDWKDLQSEFDDLKKEMEDKNSRLKSLLKKKDELESKKSELLTSKAVEIKLTETQHHKLKQILEDLQKDRDRFNKRIEILRKKIAGLKGIPDPKEKDQMLIELKNLERQLQVLDKRIEEVMDMLARNKEKLNTEDILSKERKLREKLKTIRGRANILGKEVKALKTQTIWRGKTQYEKPMFVDCRKDVYIIYPDQITVSKMDIDNKSIFKERAIEHDIIILLVRSEGYDSFRKAYAMVKKMKIPLGYEPIDDGESLDFLKE